MHTITTRYEPIKVQRTEHGTCPICDKRVSRSKTFSMTVSPFNKNPDGTVRTRQEVWEAVKEKANEWVPDFTHEKCREES